MNMLRVFQQRKEARVMAAEAARARVFKLLSMLDEMEGRKRQEEEARFVGLASLDTVYIGVKRIEVES